MTARSIFASWLDTCMAMHLSEAGLSRRRAKLWKKMAPVLACSPLLADLAGSPLEKFSVIEPSTLRRRFAEWNTLGVSMAEARFAADDAEGGGKGFIRPGISAGFSTGTSLERGVFLTSHAERNFYIGQSLAKLMPAHTFLSGTKIALFLRANSPLYTNVAASGKFNFSYFPLNMSGSEKIEALRKFAPDTLIAPPHVLSELAHQIESTGSPIHSIKRIFDGAEPMGTAEKLWIGKVFSTQPRSVYQATEGFLGATCRFGNLHLNEDSLEVELDPIAGTSVFRPIVTDLKRTSQPIVRVRLDDVIEPLGGHCACGFKGRMIRPIAGRVQDIWRFNEIALTPRSVSDALEKGLGPRTDWVAEGRLSGITISLCDAKFSSAALFALQDLVTRHHVRVPMSVQITKDFSHFPKRRRVRWEQTYV